MQDIYWNQFIETGKVKDYLCYKSEKKEENQERSEKENLEKCTNCYERICAKTTKF